MRISRTRSSSSPAPAAGWARRPPGLSAQGASVVLGARRQDRIQALARELTGERRQGDRRDDGRHRPRPGEEFGGRGGEGVRAGRRDGQQCRADAAGAARALKIDEWDRTIDVNIKGVLYGIAAALPYMQQQKSGHFINVSSVAGHKVGPGFAVYAATKFAVRALSEGLRQEVKPYNIRTTVISPGAVATELLDSMTDPDAAARVRKFYAEAAIPADSFARAVAFAISQPEDVDINEILFRPTRQEY